MNNNKKIVVADKDIIRESVHHYAENGLKATNILITDPITGKVLARQHNKVMAAGSSFTACKHFDIQPKVKLPNYNTALGLDEKVDTDPESEEFIYIFAVGIDGAGSETSQILSVDPTKWCAPKDLVPFRYVEASADALVDREKYFGRKTGPDYIAYYFKAFESVPVMYQRFTDGTDADAGLYESKNTSGLETIVELNLKVTKEDCREFFKATTGLEDARINTIELLTCWKKTINGKVYYQNIQPATKLNISTEFLSDETKGLDILYHLYY